MGEPSRKPQRLLIVMPNWVGDAVMATPACRVIRELLPGAFIGALVRPGIDELLAGLTLFDEVHVSKPTGVMGPKRTAAAVRPRRYDTALLLTNSFSTALTTRIAGIPRRIGYDRDGRHMLLTERLQPRKRRDTPPFDASGTDPGGWAPVPACRYYFEAAEHLLRAAGMRAGGMGPLELSVTHGDELAARDVLDSAGVPREAVESRRLLLLNPGGNNPAKRWPPERFAEAASRLHEKHGVFPVINGAPRERELTDTLADLVPRGCPRASLPGHGITLAALKAIVGSSRLMITNDTGPRHIAAALGVPVVTLFGPTDPRWTTIPFEDEVELVADPELPAEEVTNDHPERCRVDRITLDRVMEASDRLLRASGRSIEAVRGRG